MISILEVKGPFELDTPDVNDFMRPRIYDFPMVKRRPLLRQAAAKFIQSREERTNDAQGFYFIVWDGVN